MTTADLIWDRKVKPGFATSIIDPGNTTGQISTDDDDESNDYQDPTKVVGNGGSYLPSAQQKNDVETQPPNSPSSSNYVPLSDPGQHPDAPGTSEEEGASQFNLDQADDDSLSGAAARAAAAAPASHPALDAYRKSLGSAPEQKSPKLWQRLAAGALGGVAGWQNATGHRGVAQIDPSAAIHNIYDGGYDRKLANWNTQNAQLGKAATLEQQEERNKAYAVMAAARTEDYKAAMKLREVQLARENNKKDPLTKAQEARASYEERVKIAKERNWNDKDQPWLQAWIADDKAVYPPKETVAKTGPADLTGLPPEEQQKIIRQRETDKHNKEVAQTANYNWLAQGEKRGGGGAGGEKPLTHVQKLRGLRQANRDKAESYRRVETGIAADMKAMGLTKGVDPMPDELKAKYDPMKQQIEVNYANDVSDYTGNDIDPYDYRKGEPVIKKEVVQPVQSVVKPIVRPPGVPGPVNRTPVMQAQPQPAAAAARPANLPAAPNVQKPKVATPEMIQQFAQHYKISIDQARNQVLHEGYTVLGR